MNKKLFALAFISLLQAFPVFAGSSIGIKTYPLTGQIRFNTPSGNIGCVYTPRGGAALISRWMAGRSFSVTVWHPAIGGLFLVPRDPVESRKMLATKAAVPANRLFPTVISLIFRPSYAARKLKSFLAVGLTAMGFLFPGKRFVRGRVCLEIVS